VRTLVNEEGEILDHHVEKNRFNVGRAGDHLITPFQCKLCHFRNIYTRNASSRLSNDREALEFFQRASLDAFWSSATTTVRGNLLEGKRGKRFASRMGVPCLIPEMGPFPLCDSMGIMSAAAVLDQSLDRGRTEHFVQWATFRGTRSFITNATQAGVSGLSDSVGRYEKSKMWISGVVTHSFWFTCFMEGLHKRVGEVRHQDEPITIEVLHELDRILEAEWQQAKLPSQKRQVAEMGTWFIVGFCSGLRGEEMLLVKLAGTARDLVFLADVVCPHFILVVSGRTKGNQLSGAKFGVPIAARTEGTNLLLGKWIQRLVKIMTVKNDTRGRLFRRNLSPTRLFEFSSISFGCFVKFRAPPC
jgi:hypothetical protein